MFMFCSVEINGSQYNLHINNPSMSHAGTYVCEIYKDKGTAEAEVVFIGKSTEIIYKYGISCYLVSVTLQMKYNFVNVMS